MGTWDDGLLDNDTALDGLAELVDGVVQDIESIGAGKPTAAAAGRLAGAIGVLLQLAPDRFEKGEPAGERLAAAVRGQAKGVARLGAGARRVLGKLAAGEGLAPAERRGRMARTHAALLHAGSEESRFGRRVPALFAGAAGAAYVRAVARRCVAMVAEDFEDPANWGDLCREGIGIGGLAALLVLAPCRVAARTIAGWRSKARRGLAGLEAEDDEELGFHRGYYRNLDRVLGILMRRFAAPPSARRGAGRSSRSAGRSATGGRLIGGPSRRGR